MNDPASLGLEPRLIGHRSQAVRTTTLPIALLGQAYSMFHCCLNSIVPIQPLPAILQ